MKKYAILAIGILMIISGVGLSFLTSFATDVTASGESTKQIEEQYASFKDLLTTMNGERENLYHSVVNEFYVEKVETDYDFWIQTYQNYEKVVRKISGYQGFLKENCLNVLYRDTNAQSKCDSMMISLETAVNYYVKDAEKFNLFIGKYNDTVELEEKKELLELGNYQYLDFNDDGKYTGK